MTERGTTESSEDLGLSPLGPHEKVCPTNSVLNREDIFIISKLSPKDHGFENTMKAIDKSLENLQVGLVTLICLYEYRFSEHYL